MSKLTKEAEFFRDISKDVRNLVEKSKQSNSIAKQKGRSGDYATHLDIAVEKLIVTKIQELFPDDLILAEESFSDTQIGNTRIWIIDPICGTRNLARDITAFCTNIALADKGKLIASCVVDHSQNEYFWSIGDNKVYVNEKLSSPQYENQGTVIDVDLGALPNDGSQKNRYTKVLLYLLDNTEYDLNSFNTSLGFAYTAIGKIDGFISVFNYPWDICASVFLIQQSGGVVSELDGSEWKIRTKGTIAARNKVVHATLVTAYTNPK